MAKVRSWPWLSSHFFYTSLPQRHSCALEDLGGPRGTQMKAQTGSGSAEGLKSAHRGAGVSFAELFAGATELRFGRQVLHSYFPS